MQKKDAVIAILGIALLLLAAIFFPMAQTFERQNACYREYRNVDIEIEGCFRSGNFTVEQCLSFWPEKTALLKVGCEP